MGEAKENCWIETRLKEDRNQLSFKCSLVWRWPSAIRLHGMSMTIILSIKASPDTSLKAISDKANSMHLVLRKDWAFPWHSRQKHRAISDYHVWQERAWMKTDSRPKRSSNQTDPNARDEFWKWFKMRRYACALRATKTTKNMHISCQEKPAPSLSHARSKAPI